MRQRLGEICCQICQNLNYITPLKTAKNNAINNPCERLADLNWRSSSIHASSLYLLWITDTRQRSRKSTFCSEGWSNHWRNLHKRHLWSWKTQTEETGRIVVINTFSSVCIFQSIGLMASDSRHKCEWLHFPCKSCGCSPMCSAVWRHPARKKLRTKIPC